MTPTRIFLTCPRRRALLLLIASLTFAAPLPAHDFADVVSFYPPPPPTVNPGPAAALLRVHVVEAKSGETLSATACINGGKQEPDVDPYRAFSLRKSGNRMIGAIRHREVPYYFYTDGRFEVRVPPGAVSLEIRKGYEFRPEKLALTVADEKGRAEWTLRHRLPIRASSWIAARAHGEAGTEAHTNPVHVEVGEEKPFSAHAARRIIARLDESMEAIALKDVVRRMGELKEDLLKQIERHAASEAGRR